MDKNKLEKQAIGIVAQLFDLTEVPVEKRQQINDTAYDYMLEQLRLHSVSNSVATEYAEFCVRCDRDKLPLLCLEDYIKQYCY